MDHHRQFHHQNHHHHHPPRQFINSPPHPSSSRYIPLRPPPPPHPPFPEDHHRNVFSHPQRHLPPPPQHHHHHHPVPPPCVLHRPPPPHPPPHQNITTFAPSPPHHHHLHQHHRDEVRRSPPGVIFPPNIHHTYNHNINHDSYYKVVDEIGHRSRFSMNELPPPNSRVSPPRFHSSERFHREIDTVPRFREDLSHEPHVRVQLHHPQEEIEFRHLHRTDRIDDCINLKSVDRFEEDFDHDRNRDHRSLGVVDRLEGDFDRGHKNLGVLERLEGDFKRRNLGVVEQLEGDFVPDRRKLGVIDRLEDRGRDYDNHERYHPEMVSREAYDLNSVNNEFFRGGLVNGDVFIRGGRDDVMEENVKRRRSSGSREVSRSPIKFRGGGMEVDDDFSDRVRKEDINECNSHGTPRKTVQKKSAFLRIQPAKQQHPPQQHSGYRNRTDNTSSSSSSQKGKESSSECLDSRVSEERVGSPVELDVSFKSNALVAKAITAAPSCSDVGLNVDKALSDSGIRLDGESPSRVVRFKINSSMSKKGGKDSKNRLRVSPMKRLGDLNDGQVRDNCSESSPSVSGSSKNHKASPNCKDLMKDKNIADFEKVSSPSVRKKRKAISPLSRLSSAESSKTDSELVNLDSLANHPSDDSMSYDTPGKKPENKSSYAVNKTGSTQNEYVDMGKIDLNESFTVLDLVSQSAAERREEKILDSLPDCSGSLGPADTEGHGDTELLLQAEQRILNPDGEVTKHVEKFSSDILTDNHCVESQGKALVNNGFVEGSSKSMATCAGNHMENNDICCENADALDSVAVMSSTMNPVNILNKNKSDVDLTCPVVDSKKGCCSLPEVATVGLSLAIDNEPSLRQTVAYGKVGSVLTGISNEKRRASLSDDDGGGAFSSKNVDVQGTDDFQEQQCQGAETTSYNEKPKLVRNKSPKTCTHTGNSSSVLNRKREAGTEPDSSYLSISESCHESALSISSCIENAMLSVEKFFSEVSGLPCVESDVSHGNEFTESCVKKMKTVDSICDLDPIEHISRRGKKRKTFTVGSNMSDAPGSQSSEFIPLAEGASVECSKLVEGVKLPKSAIVEKELDRATSSSCAMLCSSANSKPDSMCKDTSLSIVGSAPPDGKQYPLAEDGCNQKIDEKLVMAGGNDHISFKLLESECTMAANVGGGSFQCLPADHIGDEDQGTLTVDMECDDTIAQNAHMCSVSGLQSCAGSINGRVTMNSDMLNMPSSASLPDPSHISPAVGASNVSLEVQSCSDEKLSTDDKKSNQPLTMRSSSTSKINLLAESQNLKPGISATSGIQSNTQKSASLLSKQVKTAPSSNMNRARRNVLTRSEASVSASHHTTVINPSNRTQAYPAKTRTWHRANNLVAVDTVKKPSIATTLPQRPLYGKASKGQDTSYIRKGNSLVRNPASGASGVATSDSRTLGASMDRSKPNVTDQIRKEDDSLNIEPSEVLDKSVTGVRSASTEMPKLPPLIGSGKASRGEIAHSVECLPSISVHQSEGTDSQLVLKSPDTSLESARDPESIVDRNMEDPGMFSDGDVRGSNSKRMIYIKRKSNQLIAASKNSHLSLHSMDRKVASSSDINYFKRRKNQLIRASSEGNIHQMLAVVEDSSNSQSQSAFQAYPGRSSTKKLSNKGKSSKRSLVWTLGDSKSCGKGMDAWKSGRLLSHLLPWKRATYWSRKLLSSRKRSVLYVRSGRGFSLRRSKVISLPGKSLKWSKSMEKRSKKAEKEAAVAVARDLVEKSGSSGISISKKLVNGLKLHSGERIFRIGVFRYRMDPSRRTLQRISDEEVDISASTTQKDARKTYVPKRLLIGSDEYIRIGNGNQLVRDPKRRTRILASEKVRWSLHTARMRSAKKRKFCQFFTRFGKCNKGEGKCPFIHDPSKIAVCTKFLNGLCADPSCQLTHKVIPERMPDCSFFLQGLCSNEKCPYRHVNVNPKASICENFLRGYCAEGNECRKKHSYICPDFEASGSCPQGSKCKLYHPKKGKAKKRKVQRDQKNSKGRYFGSALSMVVDPETRPLLEKHVETNKDDFSFDGDMGDFISLDVSDDDDEVQENVVGSQQNSLSGEDDIMSLQLDDNDDLIKPFRILGRV